MDNEKARSSAESPSDTQKNLLIGAVAERTGLSLRSVRYYEEAGLLSPTRTAGGFRLFDDDAVERLTVIMRMKPLGFTLDEMRVLLDLRDRLAETTSADERAELAQQLDAWQELAMHKLTTLQEQVEIAEQFLAGLRGDVARWKR